MAIPNGLTPSLPSGAAGWLSKAKIGDTVYAIKDAQLRAMLDTGAQKEAVNSITKTGEGANYDNDHVPTTKAILDYLESAIQGLTGAMHFAGVTDPESGATPEARIADLYGEKTPEAGDIVIDGTTEYVYDGSNWKELGDEGVYATKGELEDAIADLEIAGVVVGSDGEITASELKTALGLGAFAYANTGTGSLSTVDSASVDFAGGTYTVSGTAVAVPQTFNALDVTPAGQVTATADSVNISYDKVSSVSYNEVTAASYDKVSSIGVTSAAAAEGETANYTPAGSVAVNADASATFTATTTTVQSMLNAGTSYSLSAGSVSQAADTTTSVAFEGITAAMDQTDTEMLVFSAAGTTPVVKQSGAVTYTDPTLSGALPTFQEVTVANGGSISLPSFSGSFTGTGAILSASANFTTTVANLTSGPSSASVSYAGTTLTVPAQNITASFSGTTKSVTPTAATSANAAPSNASISIEAATLTVDFISSNKTITVTPAGA